MSIYRKVANIQKTLMKKAFQTKKGYHNEYISLPEMLPPIMDACCENELTLYFTATLEQLVLKLVSWDGKEEFSTRVRLPELTKDEKKEGANLTYLKRYLLMNTFLIIEDSIDPDDYDTSASSAPNNKSSEGIDGVIERTVELLKAKGVNDDEITPRAIYNTVNSNKELPQTVKTNMLDWYKGLTKEEKTSVYVGASA